MIDTLFVAVISLLLKSGLCVSFASVQGKENHCPMSCVEAETFYGACPVYVDCASVLYAVLYLLLPYLLSWHRNKKKVSAKSSVGLLRGCMGGTPLVSYVRMAPRP